MKDCKDVIPVSVSEIEDDDDRDVCWDPSSSPVWDKSRKGGGALNEEPP